MLAAANSSKSHFQRSLESKINRLLVYIQICEANITVTQSELSPHKKKQKSRTYKILLIPLKIQ